MFGLGPTNPGVANIALVVVVGLIAASAAIALAMIVGQALARRRRSSVNRFIPMGRLSPVLGGLAMLVAALVVAQAAERYGGWNLRGGPIAWFGL